MIKHTKPITDSYSKGYDTCHNPDCENPTSPADSFGHCHECVEAWVSYAEAKADGE